MSVSDPQLRIVQLERELQWAHLKIQVLEERLRQQRIRMLGPHSETLTNLQLELLAAASDLAIAAPISLDAPVTTATLPVSLLISFIPLSISSEVDRWGRKKRFGSSGLSNYWTF